MKNIVGTTTWSHLYSCLLRLNKSSNSLCLIKFNKTNWFGGLIKKDCFQSSAYHFLRAQDSVVDAQQSNFQQDAADWSNLWKLKVVPRHSHLVWRIMHDKLPLGYALFKRSVLNSPLCVCCHEEVETASHIFMGCEWAQMVWFASPLGVRFEEQFTNGVLFKDWLIHIINHAEPEVLALIFSICYDIWFSRNKLCFEQVVISIPQLIHKAVSSVHEYGSQMMMQSALVSDAEQQPVVAPNTWIPPPINYYKLNVDAAGPMNDTWGIGAIIRNHAGEVMAAGRWSVPCLNDAAVTEAIALRCGIQFALDLFLIQLQAETDSSNVVAAFNFVSLNNNYMELVIQDCKRIRNSFSSLSCNHVRRNANQAAHGLTKSILISSDRVWMEEIPECIANIVSLDVSSISVE